jgi:hypothetical protein
MNERENTNRPDADDLPDGAGPQADQGDGEDTASGGGADDR